MLEWVSPLMIKAPTVSLSPKNPRFRNVNIREYAPEVIKPKVYLDTTREGTGICLPISAINPAGITPISNATIIAIVANGMPIL